MTADASRGSRQSCPNRAPGQSSDPHPRPPPPYARVPSRHGVSGATAQVALDSQNARAQTSDEVMQCNARRYNAVSLLSERNTTTSTPIQPSSAPHGAQYGVFVCSACRDDPGEECGDYCGQEFADAIPSLSTGYDMWPPCGCCGQRVQLVVLLIAA